MKAVIFSGGIGSRLWPLSRKKSPKQFINYVHEKSMFQMAVHRLFPDFTYDDIYIVTGTNYYQELIKQVPELRSNNCILEPEMRDVGPAVGLVASIFSRISPDEPIAIIWGSDHLVKDEAIFRKLLKEGETLVRKYPNKMVFFGQKPRFPSTNLGWIAKGKKITSHDGIVTYEFKGWKYRPNSEDAEVFYKNRTHVWNPGYFVTTAGNLWNLYLQHANQMAKKLSRIASTYGTSSYKRTLEEIYPQLDKVHFDTIILEKIALNQAVVMVTDFGWSDVGAWEQLKEALQTAPRANVTQGNVILEDSEDNLVYNYDEHKLIVGIDLDDFLVVNTPDVLLVTKKTSVSKIKAIVSSLSSSEYEHLT